MNIVTYQSNNATNSYRWLAYIVLPNGKYWSVMFHGASEEEAKANAVNAWNAERSKCNRDIYIEPTKPLNDPWADAAKHHLTNKVWMRHKETRDLIRVPLTEITMYEQRNYERSGPRSK